MPLPFCFRSVTKNTIKIGKFQTNQDVNDLITIQIVIFDVQMLRAGQIIRNVRSFPLRLLKCSARQVAAESTTKKLFSHWPVDKHVNAYRPMRANEPFAF